MGPEMDFCVLLVLWWVLRGWENQRAAGNLYKKLNQWVLISKGQQWEAEGAWEKALEKGRNGGIQRKWNV